MNKQKRISGGNLRQYSMLIVLVVIIVFFQLWTGDWKSGSGLGAFGSAWATGKLLVPMNVSNLIAQNAYVVILAIGMLICILTGGNIDLSVGSVVAVVGSLAGTFIIEQKMNVYLAAALCLGVGLLIGVWQGFWIAYWRIPSFIVTLSSMLVFRGLTLSVLKGLTLAPFPQEYMQYSTGFIPNPLGTIVIGGTNFNGTALLVGALVVLAFAISQVWSFQVRKRKGYAVGSAASLLVKLLVIGGAVLAFFMTIARYKGVPTVLVLIGILLLIYSFFTSNTVMGRHIYAIGGNEKAARLSGVKTNKMLFLTYVNMALLASVAGLVFAARLNSASPQAGQNFELDAIAACYIGGASAYGGIGTVSGSLIGALIMGVLNNGMSLRSLDTSIQQVVKGLVLLAAVAFDVASKKQTALSALRLPFRRKSKAESIAL